MPQAQPQPWLQPTCETDESSDEGLPRRKSNVSAKRTSQTELGKNHAMDLTSDSGYSSRTAATGSSADSAKSANNSRGSPVKSEAPPAAPEAPALPSAPTTSPARPRRRPSESTSKSTQAHETLKSSKASRTHNKTPVVLRQKERTTSVSRPRRDSAGQDNHDQGKSRQRLSPLNTAMADNYSSHIPRSPRVPSSPRTPLSYYNHSSVETQIAGSPRPRLYERPRTYYGGSALSADCYSYAQLGVPYGTQHQFHNTQYGAMAAAPSPAGYYGHVPPSPLSAPCEAWPPMQRGMGDGYQSRPPVQNLPNPRYGAAPSPVVYQQEPAQDYFDEYDEGENGYYRHGPPAANRNQMIMAPPPRPSAEPPRRRPSLRSQTTGNIPRSRQPPGDYRGRANDYDYEEDLVSGTQSLQLAPPRPSITESYQRSYNGFSSREEPVLVQPARSGRPRDADRETTKRNTMFNMNVVSTLDSDNNFRRNARADDKRKDKLDSKVNNVEAYLDRMGGNYGAVVDSLRTKAARGRASSNGARTRTRASSHSQHSHDGASRISDGSHSTSTRKTAKDGNVTIRVDGDDLTLEGDMNGKVVNVTKGEDGNQQIIISDYKGRESQYLREGSRVTTNTSSSRSRSDRDSARPRGTSHIDLERDLERERQLTRQQRRVRYADEPNRQYSRSDWRYR